MSSAQSLRFRLGPLPAGQLKALFLAGPQAGVEIILKPYSLES